MYELHPSLSRFLRDDTGSAAIEYILVGMLLIAAAGLALDRMTYSVRGQLDALANSVGAYF